MKNALVSVVAVALFASLGLVGCASNEDGEAAPAEDLQTITGRLDTGSSQDSQGLSTKTITVGAGLHVVAHRLGKKGSANVDIDAPVAADGSFDLHLARGARYVFELERGAESVAFFGWNAAKTATAAAEKANVLAIAATTKGKAAISLGRIAVAGNGAMPEVSPADSFDPNDTTGIDLTAEWFVSAKGAILSANEALEEASKALEEASKALEEASKALDEANDALDDAQKQVDDAMKTAHDASDDE